MDQPEEVTGQEEITPASYPPASHVLVDAEVILALLQERLPLLEEVNQAALQLKREMKTIKISSKKEIIFRRLEIKKDARAMNMELKRESRGLKQAMLQEQHMEKYRMVTRLAGMILLAVIVVFWLQHVP